MQVCLGLLDEDQMHSRRYWLRAICPIEAYQLQQDENQIPNAEPVVGFWQIHSLLTRIADFGEVREKPAHVECGLGVQFLSPKTRIAKALQSRHQVLELPGEVRIDLLLNFLDGG